MRRRRISIPELALVAGTRVALGAGIGMLVGNRLNDGARTGAGWALLGVGAITTIPIMASLFRKRSLRERLVT